MNRPDCAYLVAITDAAEEWLRRCNNRPREGLSVGRVNLRVVLAASTDVNVDDRGWIIWRADGRMFTAQPVPAGQDQRDLSIASEDRNALTGMSSLGEGIG